MYNFHMLYRLQLSSCSLGGDYHRTSHWLAANTGERSSSVDIDERSEEGESGRFAYTMKFHVVNARSAIRVTNKTGFRSAHSKSVSESRQNRQEFLVELLDRRWMLPNPATKIHKILVSPNEEQKRMRSPFNDVSYCINPRPNLGGHLIVDYPDLSFYIIRDDLLHPLVNGNKARKLDALLPLIEDHFVTDVVTCGGCQSAHAAAFAVSSAERGIKSHLLLRGEQPEILTGYNLISTLYGKVTYVPRSLYANRERMLQNHADIVAGRSGCIVNCNDLIKGSFTNHRSVLSDSLVLDAQEQVKKSLQKVLIVNEGAGDAVALLGMFRLVNYLSQDHLLGRKRSVKFVLDAGTGTTAVGLGFAAFCLRLSWEVTAVMLADTIERYREQERRLFRDFMKQFGSFLDEDNLNKVDSGLVNWVERRQPRKFGNVLEGEIEVCRDIAQQTGVLVDPVYTLAAWEKATQLAMEHDKCGTDVVMLHTGGTLGMFGLAQRYKSYFRLPKD